MGGQLPIEMIALDVRRFSKDNVPEELRHGKDELLMSATNQQLRDLLMSEHGQSLKLLILGKLRSIVDDIEDEDQLDYEDRQTRGSCTSFTVRSDKPFILIGFVINKSPAGIGTPASI